MAKPCQHLGEPTGEFRDHSPRPGLCHHVPLRRCAVHGVCGTVESGPGVAACERCPDYAPDPSCWLAPLGAAGEARPWQGPAPVKPWEYRVTVAVPCLLSPDLLAACVALVRAQAEPCYLVLVDTGTPWQDVGRVEALRGPDCEVHYLRGHAYAHAAGPVMAAYDLAWARCETEVLVTLHQDTLLCRREAVGWLAAQVSEVSPVAGWEQSERAGAGWRGCVGHVFTAFHMPTMRRHGVTWSWRRWLEAEGPAPDRHDGYPDAEQPVNRCLRQAGITPVLLGREQAAGRQVTAWWDHPRSAASAAIGAAVGWATEARQGEVGAAAAEALREAHARLRAWGRGAGHGQPLPAPGQLLDAGGPVGGVEALPLDRVEAGGAPTQQQPPGQGQADAGQQDADDQAATDADALADRGTGHDEGPPPGSVRRGRARGKGAR